LFLAYLASGGIDKIQTPARNIFHAVVACHRACYFTRPVQFWAISANISVAKVKASLLWLVPLLLFPSSAALALTVVVEVESPQKVSAHFSNMYLKVSYSGAYSAHP
jgi:hypothetical protein